MIRVFKRALEVNQNATCPLGHLRLTLLLFQRTSTAIFMLKTHFLWLKGWSLAFQVRTGFGIVKM